MGGLIYGFFKALFEQLFKPRKPPSVGTDPGKPGSVEFMRRLRRERDSRPSPPSDTDPGEDS